MKKLYLLFFMITFLTCTSSDNKEEVNTQELEESNKKKSVDYIVTYKKDGKTIKDTMTIDDEYLNEAYQDIINGKKPKPRPTQNSGSSSFVFGLKNALKYASGAEKIMAYSEKWPQNTSSAHFFELIEGNVKLKEINFCHISINKLPPSISTVSNLEVLELPGANITSIPKTIGKLKKLRILDFGNKNNECLGNKINLIPKEIGQCESLEFLGLAFSNISYLPKELKNCKRLKKIDIYQNKAITKAKLKELKNRFPNIEFVSHLK